MTPAEAIELIKKVAFSVENEIEEIKASKFITALKTAIEALEKLIPQKPILQGDGYADGELVYDYAECPVCGCDFEEDVNDWGCKFCPDCGQALDWSES